MNLNMKFLIVTAVAATPIFFWSGSAPAADPNIPALQELGKNIFFDEISIPGNKQACASCHNPAKGWILPDSTINAGQVVAPGAKPHTEGKVKPPMNAYNNLSPPLINNGTAAAGFQGGNFWNGRATGAGKNGADFNCTALDTPGVPPDNFTCGPVVASRTVKPSDIPAGLETYQQFLGPVTDQALNPFTVGGNEQNIREQNVCQRVKTAPYKALYKAAYGVDIDCSPDPQLPEEQRAYDKSFKLIALAIGAWQRGPDVNSFSSRVDEEMNAPGQTTPPTFAKGSNPDDPNGPSQFGHLTNREIDGHALFYSTFFTPIVKDGRAIATNCSLCHNSGTAVTDRDELYTDFGYHNIGLPYNHELAGGTVPKFPATGANKGLGDFMFAATADGSNGGNALNGHRKTPSMRNVAKGLEGGFTKAYTFNGYFKSLERIVHFYNSSKIGSPTANSFGITQCTGNLTDATDKEAEAANCWPAPEFPDTAGQNLVIAGRPLIGDMQMNADEEAALVAYLKALSDRKTPTKP